MNENQTKKVIVVLSAGRSGTSLLMKALGNLGMTLSKDMIPGSMGNPEGFFEDAEIVQVHQELFEKLHTKPTLPLPDGWLESDPIKKARPQLRKILEERLAQSNTMWGFKDPRTVSFLPLWSRILNAPGTVPVFLLAVRDPATVATSLKRQINRAEAVTELQWLQRTCDALHHTSADCFIVHYEDWFTRPNEMAQGLLQYTGLDQYFTSNIDEALKEVIKPNLNRAVYNEYTVQNEYVLKLYDVLKDCRGDDFDRVKLMETAKACRKAMNAFKGWSMEAQKYLGQHETLRGKVRNQSEMLEKKNKRATDLETDLNKEKQHATDLETDLQKLTLQNNDYLKESKDYFDEVENLRKKISALEQAKQKELNEKQDLLNKAPTRADALKNELINVHSKNRTLLQQKEVERQYSQNIKKLIIWMNQLENDYFAVKCSRRWKIGNFMVRCIELLLLKKKVPLATDHLEKIFHRYKSSLPLNPDKTSQDILIKSIKQTRHDFNSLFNSKRWKSGNFIISLVERALFRGQRPMAKEHIDKIWGNFEAKKHIFLINESNILNKNSSKPFKRKPKVSVIIPVFNKDEFIGPCLDSVLNKGTDTIEVICVNDNSTDDSQRIIQEYEQKDSRVRLFSHRTNSGASAARNLGIFHANGEYLFFLDADDMIAENAIERMIETAEDQWSDIVRGKITGMKTDGTSHKLAAEHLLHSGTKYRVNWAEEESLWFYWYFTANLYRTQFIKENRIIFPRGIRNEDPFFLCRCFLAAKNICLHPDTTYYYRIGAEQSKKSPTPSFLTGWSMGNYYLYQLFQTQYKQAQYFMVHFPSFLDHSINTVRYLDKEQAYSLLTYIQLIFSHANLDYYASQDSQPWTRKKQFSEKYIDYLSVLQSEPIRQVYDYLVHEAEDL